MGDKIRSKMSEDEQRTVDDKLEDARKLKNFEAPEGVVAEIVDPNSQRPDDWDDEEDGEWEPRRIPNPELKDIEKLLADITSVVDPIMANYPVEDPPTDDEDDAALEEPLEDLDLEDDVALD